MIGKREHAETAPQQLRDAFEYADLVSGGARPPPVNTRPR